MIFIKIVLLTPYYCPIIGGITSFVANLKNSLSKKEVEISVIARQGEGKNDVEVIDSNRYLFILRAFLSIKRKKLDVLHSHSHWFMLFPCCLYKAFHPHTKVIHTFHTEPLKRNMGLKKKVFEYLISKCDYITFVSKNLMSKFDEIYEIRSQKMVIYAGTFLDKKGKEEVINFQGKHNLRGCFPILSFVGPLSWEKKVEGVKRLIEAFKIVKRKYPTARLLIVGDGIYRTELESLVEQNQIKDEVVFTGFMESSYIPLSVTNIYTHISLQEGFPIAILEAMSLGLPVVASDTGGIPELIVDRENGILVKPKPNEIAEIIIELCNDKEKMEILGKNAEKAVKEGHKWDDIAMKFMALYTEKT